MSVQKLSNQAFIIISSEKKRLTSQNVFLFYHMCNIIQAEELGCEGKVEEAQGVMKLCEQLKEERTEMEAVSYLLAILPSWAYLSNYCMVVHEIICHDLHHSS